MYDIIIIGGGPAGMSAALYAQRNGKKSLVIEQQGFGGQISNSPRVENIPGFSSISGSGFADAFMDQIMEQGAELTLECVDAILPYEGGFTVHTQDENSYEGKTVILATGVKHRLPGIGGEESLIGNGIAFCAVCDGDFYKGKEVVVLGGGNSALQEAVLLSEGCSKVTILQDMPMLTGEAKLKDWLYKKDNVRICCNTKLLAYETKQEKLCAVVYQNEAGEIVSLSCSGLFVAIGLIPQNKPFAHLVSLDKQGYFDINEDCISSIPGLYVAGDCRKKTLRQVTTACSDGATAAIAACRYIDSL